MFLRSFATFVSAAGLLAISGACGGGSETSPSPTESGDAPLAEEVTGSIGDFFTEGESTTGEAGPGDEFQLPGGGNIAIPAGSSHASIVVTKATPTEDGLAAFSEWNSDTEAPDSVLKVALSFSGSASDYVILSRPATDPASRIYAAGYVDGETGDPDWSSVPSLFDSDADEVTAAVGLGIFQPTAKPQVSLLPGAIAGEDVIYIAFIAVAVSHQTLASLVAISPTVPVEAFEVEYDGPDVQVAAKVGAQLRHITNRPLDSLSVTSPFGRRPRPTKGASTNHEGNDYRAASGTTVYAAGAGQVTIARCQLDAVNCGKKANGDITGGYYVEIDHGDGERTRYFHMTQPASVGVGNPVTGGQSIGVSDATGGVDAHLHFEVIKNGVPLDSELLFNERLRATVAMAIDFNLQGDTKMEIPVKIDPTNVDEDDLTEDYAAAVSLQGVTAGSHLLQFMSVQPDGSLELITQIPFTVKGGPFPGVSGHWLIQQDTRYTNPTGDHDDVRLTYQATFSLVAINDTQLQGQGHLEYIVNDEFTEAYSLCPITSHIATSEWDVFWEGTYHINDDGSIDVNFAGTPGNGPDYESIWNAPGCPEKTYTETLPGQGTPAIAGTLVNGEYYHRDDNTLDEGTVGEDYFEELIDISNSE